MMAVHIFRCHPDELKQRITSRQFDELAIFFQYEPFPDPWHLTGRICETIARVNGAKRINWTDFRIRPKKPKQTAGQIEAVLMASVRLQQEKARKAKRKVGNNDR